MKKQHQLMNRTDLSLQKKSGKSVVKKKLDELVAAFNPKDPAEEIAIEMIASSYAQWKEIESCRLGDTSSIFGFEVEARVKNLAARHLKEMIFFLRELQRTPVPSVHIKHAEKIQVAVVDKGV